MCVSTSYERVDLVGSKPFFHHFMKHICRLSLLNMGLHIDFSSTSFCVQVYKMVVEWTSGTTSIVYRRYSMFFDFQVNMYKEKLIILCMSMDVVGTYVRKFIAMRQHVYMGCVNVCRYWVLHTDKCWEYVMLSCIIIHRWLSTHSHSVASQSHIPNTASTHICKWIIRE